MNRVETIKANMKHRLAAGFLGITGQVNGYTVEPDVADPQTHFLFAHCPAHDELKHDCIRRICLAAATIGTADANRQMLIGAAHACGLFVEVLDETSATADELFVSLTCLTEGTRRARVYAMYEIRKAEARRAA